MKRRGRGRDLDGRGGVGQRPSWSVPRDVTVLQGWAGETSLPDPPKGNVSLRKRTVQSTMTPNRPPPRREGVCPVCLSTLVRTSLSLHREDTFIPYQT